MSEHPFLPILTVNRAFMAEFISAPPPCFALGLMEESKQELGFLAMRPDELIPSEITHGGFKLGHTLIGTSDYVVIQFVFEFYGFGRYHVLINPNNPVVQTVLSRMIKSGDYFFLSINPDQTVITFRARIMQGDLVGLKANFPQIQGADTTETQYLSALSVFSENPEPSGTVMDWVCQDNMDYLDLTSNRLDLNPR